MVTATLRTIVKWMVMLLVGCVVWWIMGLSWIFISSKLV